MTLTLGSIEYLAKAGRSADAGALVNRLKAELEATKIELGQTRDAAREPSPHENPDRR